MSGDGKVTIELIDEINAAFDSRDPDRIASYFAEDGIFATARGPDPGVIASRDAITYANSWPSDSKWCPI